jgi:charged multivesicular body protein 6
LLQLEGDSQKLTAEAKELIRQQKKERALLCLKLRKYKENELNQIDGKLLSIMEMIEQVEWESANMEVLKALQSGNEVLNKYHQEMSVDDVEALLEETNEAIEVCLDKSEGF